MEQKTTSKKFVNEFRGVLKTESYRCLSTFNYGEYKNEHRNSFGILQVVNDEYLAPNQTIEYHFEENQQVLLLALVGALDFVYSKQKGFVHSNQIQILSIKKK